MRCHQCVCLVCGRELQQLHPTACLFEPVLCNADQPTSDDDTAAADDHHDWRYHHHDRHDHNDNVHFPDDNVTHHLDHECHNDHHGRLDDHHVGGFDDEHDDFGVHHHIDVLCGLRRFDGLGSRGSDGFRFRIKPHTGSVVGPACVDRKHPVFDVVGCPRWTIDRGRNDRPHRPAQGGELRSMSAPSAAVAPHVDEDVPRPLKPGLTRADFVFRLVLSCGGGAVLLVLGAIIFFLVINGAQAFHKYGFHIITSARWAPPLSYGILGALVGSVVIAVMALAIALPLSITTALMINEYAPAPVRRLLVVLVDLLATVPSIVYGFWGLIALTVYVHGPTVFLGDHGGFIPLFRSPNPGTYGQSIFLCGLVVGVMIIPIVTSISREVMARAPRDACEGALALGGTRWGMVTDVILPFSRNGIIGASLLGLGRALGETMAVLLILSPSNILTPDILGPNGLGSISYLIANLFDNSPKIGDSVLTEAGLVLLISTLLINLVARVVVDRAGGSLA